MAVMVGCSANGGSDSGSPEPSDDLVKACAGLMLAKLEVEDPDPRFDAADYVQVDSMVASGKFTQEEAKAIQEDPQVDVIEPIIEDCKAWGVTGLEE